MAFESRLSPRETVIDDGNAHLYAGDYVSADGRVICGRGRVARDYTRQPFGGLGFAKPMPVGFVIPRSEWADRVEQLERTKSRVSDVLRRYNVPPLNQSNTNYCWANGPVTALQYAIAASGSPYIELSAASVAARIKNGRNEGGWGGDAVEFMVEHGINTVDEWPVNSRDVRQYDTEENRRKAAMRKVTEWYELDARDFDSLATLCLRGFATAVGYNWWGHEVCACDLVALPGRKWGIRIRNSWGDWEDNGFSVLTESKATPDDAVAPVVLMAA